MTTGTATVRFLASRTAGRRSPNLPGAIYGTIIATAVVAGLGEAGSVSSERALAILLGTGAVIWAAEVYSSLLAGRIRRRRTSRDDVSRVMSREWPVFLASLPLTVPLVLGWIFVVVGAYHLCNCGGGVYVVAWVHPFGRIGEKKVLS